MKGNNAISHIHMSLVPMKVSGLIKVAISHTGDNQSSENTLNGRVLLNFVAHAWTSGVSRNFFRVVTKKFKLYKI